jgi:mannose-6-phosphate isomerase-like protein (cupin superfamily)
MPGLIISDPGGAQRIRGLHGGRGELRVKRLATGNMMYTDFDAFEWAELPDGSAVGLHTHSRTEELYFIVKGRGRLRVNDQVYEVSPGDLMMMSLFGQHSIEPLDGEAIEMVVIEALPPKIARALPFYGPTDIVPGEEGS